MNDELEIWKDIEGYEGLYQVSNYGRVRSLDKITKAGKGCKLHKGKIRKLREDKDGYLTIVLYDGKRRNTYRVSRLVAYHFVTNDDPINKTQVNHIDENKQNDYYKNLEWCTPSYNINYGNRNKKSADKQKGKKIPRWQIDLVKKANIGRVHTDEEKRKRANSHRKMVMCVETGEIYKGYDVAANAKGIKGCGHISECTKGKRKTCGGYHWKDVED